MDYVSYERLGNNGRLGNQLWQIASTVGIAHSTHRAPVFPTWEYQPYFRVPDWMFWDELPPDAREDLGADFLQDLRHFAWLDTDDDQQIRGMFQPSEDAMKHLASRYATFWVKEHTTAVHVRRGDITTDAQRFPLPSPDYFRRARDHVADQDPDTCFLLFTDDPDWCQDKFDVIFGDYDHEYIIAIPDTSGPDDHYDLQLMSFCDRHIISNSTFSWWGAYLSQDDEILYPSTWFAPHVEDPSWRRMFNDRFREVES